MKNLTEGNIYKTFILFAIPIVLTGLLSTAYNIIDSMIAGSYLGADALAAIGCTASYITLLTSLFWGYAGGASLHSAVLFGAKDYVSLKESIINNVYLYILLAVVTSVLTLIFKGPIFSFLKVDHSVYKDASVYFVIIIIFNFLVALSPFFAFTCNSLGMSSYPLKMSVISTIINIGGNILSVALFNFGVTGIAVSSIIAALVVDVFYILKLKKCFSELGVNDYKVKVNLKTIKETVAYSVPVTIQQIIMYISSFVVSPFVNMVGASATAAYDVSLKIYNISAGIYQNSAKTLTNYTAQCIGAQKYDKIQKGLKVGFLQGVALLTPVLLLSVVFAKPICQMFFPKDYVGDALKYSVIFVKCVMPFLYVNMINNLFHSFFRGVKAMKFLLFFTALGSLSRIIATLVLAPKHGIYGVYAGWAVSWIIEAVFAFVAYLSKGWKSY